jgi:hypothetical protein
MDGRISERKFVTELCSILHHHLSTNLPAPKYSQKRIAHVFDCDSLDRFALLRNVPVREGEVIVGCPVTHQVEKSPDFIVLWSSSKVNCTSRI